MLLRLAKSRLTEESRPDPIWLHSPAQTDPISMKPRHSGLDMPSEPIGVGGQRPKSSSGQFTYEHAGGHLQHKEDAHV
jgi:hypothetical protein